MKLSIAELLVLLDAARVAESLQNVGHIGGSYTPDAYFAVRKSVTDKLGSMTLDVEIEKADGK